VSTVLVTGASGFIGRSLIKRLRPAHKVIAIARGEVSDVDFAVRGNFTSPADLQKLDSYELDTVVHLAAVLEEAPEEECLAVAALGTAGLLRYAI
jgi:nucleoside-diphosphate-sugar epimerase